MARRAEIPFEEIGRLPLPGMAVPVQIAFSPSDELLSYLYAPDGSLDRRLYVKHLGSPAEAPREIAIAGGRCSEDELTTAEKLRRERSRETGLGITSATWARDGDVLLVPLADGLHVLTGLSSRDEDAIETLVASSERGQIEDPRLSPDGTQVAFVRAGEVFVSTVADPGAGETRLTFSAEDGLFNGLAEYVAQEEMGRPHGYWWSPDGSHIAYTEVDERHISPYRIVHQADDGPGPSSYEEHRYPFAGGPNAIVRLGVVRASGGETIWMDTGEADSYLARVHFTASGGLAAELESRDQHTLDLVRLDLQSGRSTLVHREQHPVWINLHDDFWALEAGENEGAFVWSSERSGFRHLELRGADGGLIRVLTGGAWAVDRLEAVDEHTGLVYFSGADNSPTERHLYSVPLMGGAVARVTTEAGTHDVVVDHACRFFADRHSSLAKPPTVTVRAIFDRSVHCVLHRCRDRRIDELELAPPELVTLDTDDGSTLYGLLYEPASHLLGDPPPLVVQVYGGPHAQLARDDWAATVSLRAQALRKLGCSVLTVDNRGSARRGIDFEAPIRFLTGHVEVADQVAGVRFAVSRGAADPDRVAVFGWSYGGYMALMCLARAGETFKAAVAGAPVTHWDGYDTHYTERYMSTPAANPQGYDSSSVLAHIGVIKGALLIVHGLIDENVHFRHTARLVNHLLRAQKPHRLLLYPTERHLPRRQRDRAWMEEQVITWLIEHLS